MILQNKQIILGITGGIAAYKSADLIRRLREAGALVRVVMTESAKQFITPLTLQAVSGYPVYDDLFDLQAEAAMGHIELARWADCILIAPATADCLARLTQGEANDLLTTLCLATSAPIAVAPAMNQAMWLHSQTQANVKRLQEQGVYIFGPAEGSQACGDQGPGRMEEPLSLLEKLSGVFSKNVLAGKKVLITAGPTHEAIDAVRFITNASSGKMGYAMASAVQEAGAVVTLVSGPVQLHAPSHMRVINVVTAKDMLNAVTSENCDIFIGCAAVTDYYCPAASVQKIPKKETSLQLQLDFTPDIIAAVAERRPKPFIVGFSAETDNLIEHAKNKLNKKNMDMIIANKVNEPGIGFGSDENAVIVLWNGKEYPFEKMRKQKLARILIKFIADSLS